jgi:hypothetical protein
LLIAPAEPQRYVKDKNMSLMDKVATGTDIFAFSLFLYLKKIYRQQFDTEYADLLAVAVSNELLSRNPGNEKGQIFLERNISTIKEKASEIKNNHDLCIAISETVKMQVLFDAKPLDTNNPGLILEQYERIGKPIEKLKEYNVYVENEMPSSFSALRKRMKEFVKMVSRFQKKVQ